MFNHREKTPRHGAPPPPRFSSSEHPRIPGMMRTSIFRLSPLILLAVALAFFFAHGAQPAQAQTTTVWTGTLTVKQLSLGLGCHSAEADSRCSETDVLTSDQFTHGATRTISEIALDPDLDELIFNAGAVGAAVDDLTLRIGAASFPLKDATHGSGSNFNDHIWTNSGLSWSVGDTVELSLTAPTPTVSLSINAGTVREGTSVTVTATLSRARSSNTVVPLEMHAGTAESGDYGTLESITIPSGSTTGTGVISTTADTDTADETFHVALKAVTKDAVYAWGATSWLTIRIEDGGLRRVSLSVSPNPVAEGGFAQVIVTMTSARWGEEASLGRAVSIPLTTTAGTAESGDYGAITATTITAGSTTAVLNFLATDDTDETFTVALDTANSAWPSGVRPGPITSVQVRINDDESATPGTLSVDTGWENPECGSAMTASETPETALVLSPAPSAEEPTEYRVLADTNGEWLVGVPILTSGSSVFTSNNNFGGLRSAYPGFTGFEFRLSDHPEVTARCTWTTGGV